MRFLGHTSFFICHLTCYKCGRLSRATRRSVGNWTASSARAKRRICAQPFGQPKGKVRSFFLIWRIIEQGTRFAYTVLYHEQLRKANYGQRFSSFVCLFWDDSVVISLACLLAVCTRECSRHERSHVISCRWPAKRKGSLLTHDKRPT